MNINNNITRFVFIFLLCCATSWSFGAPDQEVVIFRKAQMDASLKPENAWVLPRLAAERDVAEKFSLKAQVALPVEMATSALEKETFELVPPSPDVANGWRSQDKGWLIGQRGAKPLVTHWKAKAGETLDLSAWNELWYEYSAAPPARACTPEIVLTAESRPSQGKVAKQVMTFASAATNSTFATVGATPSFMPLQALPLGERRLVEKDYRYLASRVARMEPDDVWRWGHARGSLVVQRRMHLDLKNSEMLEIALRPGIQIEGVNFLVSQQDNQSPGELIEFFLPPVLLDSITGLPTLRLNIREALKEWFPDRFPPNDKDAAALKNWFIQEAFIFIRNPPTQGFDRVPIESLRTLRAPEQAVLGKADQEMERILLPSREDRLGTDRARLVVNLNGLRKFQSLTLASIETRVAVPSRAEGCAIAPGKLYRVFAGQSGVPNFVLYGAQEWSKRLGGPYLFPGREEDRFESVEMLAYLPFTNRVSPLPEKDNSAEPKPGAETALARRGEMEGDEKNTTQKTPVHRFRGSGDGGREEKLGLAWISPAGEGFDAPPGSRFTQENDALNLEGHERQISVKWPLRAQLKENSHLFVSLLKGAEQVGFIDAALELANGQTIRRSLQPNTGLKLGAGENEVRRVTLTFHFVKLPFRIKLREAAIFVPRIMDEREAFLSRFPQSTDLSPMPLGLTGAITTDAAEGRISALMSPDGDGVARFKTALTPSLEAVKGIRLGFAIPNDWVGSACPLSIELVGSHASLARALCFDKAAGEIFLPLAQWLAAAKGGTNIGALREIRWEVRRSGGGRTDAFSFNWHIEGWRMLNQMELIEDSVPFWVGDRPFRVGRLAEGERGAIADGRREFWLPLRTDALGVLLNKQDYAERVENRVFRVEQVVLASKSPIASDKWLQLIAPPDNNHGRWIKLIFIALLIGILVWLGRKVILSQLLRVLKVISASISMLRTVADWLRGPTLLICRLVNQVVIMLVFFMLLPSAYWAGTRGFTREAFFIGFSMLVLGGGALLHARPLPRWAAGVENTFESLQHGLRFSALIAILLAVWAVGAHGTVSGAALALLPLAAIAYWQLPRIVTYGKTILSQSLSVASHGIDFVGRHILVSSFLFFLALTLALFTVSMTTNVSSGENYLLTFGSMVAVIALRYAILSLQPVMTHYWPSTAENIYRGGGALYFSGALVMLAAAALLFVLKLELLAKLTAIVAYYCLVVGVVIEIAALRREKGMSASTGAPDQQCPP